MGIYDPLNCYLSELGQDIVRITFSEIEKVLNCSLPYSAYTYNEWWANGGHSHASVWLDAGYKVVSVDFSEKVVTFVKNSAVKMEKAVARKLTKTTPVLPVSDIVARDDTITVCGYKFSYLQDLIPDCNADGNIRKYYPQNKYINKKGLTLSHYGDGVFCCFRIEAGNWPGVYLWVVEGNIIYIGETSALRRRFNEGYGNISPRNCYVGGQSTNCKMNKVVLDHFERGKRISLYFYKTKDYKRVELELLNHICTPYNKKNN